MFKVQTILQSLCTEHIQLFSSCISCRFRMLLVQKVYETFLEAQITGTPIHGYCTYTVLICYTWSFGISEKVLDQVRFPRRNYFVRTVFACK